MKVGALSVRDFAGALAAGTLALRTGAFLLALRSPLRDLAAALHRLYDDNDCVLQPPFADFHVTLDLRPGLRRWLRPQVLFELDGYAPFQSLPRGQVLPYFEWGLNWCIANHGPAFLIIHAASLERDGRALILPGPPGAGKSTLCAALVLAGWRLLSDELTLIDRQTGGLAALARPVSLKNRSIELIQGRAPAGVFSAPVHDTQKGTIVLMKAPPDSVARDREPARPGWIIFPRYQDGAAARLRDKAKEETAIELARNAFNYSLYGAEGFTLLTGLVEASACYGFTYGSLEDALAQIAALP